MYPVCVAIIVSYIYVYKNAYTMNSQHGQLTTFSGAISLALVNSYVPKNNMKIIESFTYMYADLQKINQMFLQLNVNSTSYSCACLNFIACTKS
jgi:hypothetical protein